MVTHNRGMNDEKSLASPLSGFLVQKIMTSSSGSISRSLKA